MEPTTGIEPVNLILTKDVLYLLSYVGIPWMVHHLRMNPLRAAISVLPLNLTRQIPCRQTK